MISKNKRYNELLNIDGIGETQVNSIKNFFSNDINLEVMDKLEKVINIKKKPIEEKNGLLKKEVDDAKNTFRKYKWPTIDVTRKSVEETAASVIKIYEIYKENG